MGGQVGGKAAAVANGHGHSTTTNMMNILVLQQTQP